MHNILFKKELALGIVILFFIAGSCGCLSIIQIRKIIQHGYFKSLGKELDGTDKTILKVSGILFLLFIISLSVRLSI